MRRRIGKIILWILALLLLSIVSLVVYVRTVSKIELPQIQAVAPVDSIVHEIDTGLFAIEKNWFRKSESGLYELYVEGKPYERGIAIGSLTQDLVQNQEKVFNDQINRLVPSKAYLHVLKYFVGWFNRDLNKHVSSEYQQEIYGISQFSSSTYDYIAPPYQRLLNYHAAHDIGHALQNMSLVGCTSFATWGADSEDGTLTIGRNFDFYVGDDFAQHKIVAFYKPEEGHPFMMITFGGMIGVLSGMNAEGLTVTINAAKSEIPSAAATPVSLVAREVLQYASTIAEAYAIIEKRKMFVAESFLIGSAKDGRAAIIEKSNESTAMYNSQGSSIICTNHFQSNELGKTELNTEHIATSASAYRFNRVEELLEQTGKNDVLRTVAILRDQKGLSGADIGLGNEKAINQLVAHHGIVFQPEKKLVWISTAPWQLGRFVCYDLAKMFSLDMAKNQEVYDKTLEIQADSFLTSTQYKNFTKMSAYRFPFANREGMNPDSVVAWNPNSYHAHMLAGDYYFKSKDFDKAQKYYKHALTKEIATTAEATHIKENLKICNEKLR